MIWRNCSPFISCDTVSDSQSMASSMSGVTTISSGVPDEVVLLPFPDSTSARHSSISSIKSDSSAVLDGSANIPRSRVLSSPSSRSSTDEMETRSLLDFLSLFLFSLY